MIYIYTLIFMHTYTCTFSMEIPHFSHTTPFHLKCSVAALHTFSTLMVLWSDQNNNNNSNSSNNNMFTVTHSEQQMNKTSSHADQSIIGDPSWWSTWVYIMRNYTGLKEIHMIMGGGPLFRHLPLIICGCVIYASFLPGVMTPSRYRTSIWTVMLFCMMYIHMCTYVAFFAVYRLPSIIMSNSKKLPSVEGLQMQVLSSVFSLHASSHCMYQCICECRRFCRVTRRCNSTFMRGITQSIMWMCILFVNFLAAACPCVGWNVSRSFQDTIVVHALVAFAPEFMGVLFDILMNILKSIF